jgi:hypothetical protein
MSAKLESKKLNVQVVTVVLNGKKSRSFTAKNNLNFVGMDFKGRRALSILSTEFNSFRISVPVFFETFRRETAEFMFFPRVGQW